MRDATLPGGARRLSADDYYAESAQFRRWLAATRRKYLGELESGDARRYFDKFVRRWNEGVLSRA